MLTSGILKGRARQHVLGQTFPTALSLSFLSLVAMFGLSLIFDDAGQNRWLMDVASGSAQLDTTQSGNLLFGMFGVLLIKEIIQQTFLLGTVWGFVGWRVLNEAPKHPYQENLRFWRLAHIKDVVSLYGVRLILTFLGFTFFFIPGVILMYSYSQADLLYADDVQHGREIKSAFGYLKASRKMMRGHKVQRLVLDLSFIGWSILDAFTFGLSLIYTMPYYQATRAEFFLELQLEQA